MKKLFLIIFVVMVWTVPVVAQDKPTSRLYIPLSPQLTIAKSNDAQTLLVKDYLNSTRGEVDENGKSLSENQYLPFGDTVDDGRDVGDDEKESEKLFTSHRKLENLSVYHAAARFYSPSTGTFIQPDRVEGTNRYAYVRNNPIRFTDPTGNEAKGIYAQIPDTDQEDLSNPEKLQLVDGASKVYGVPLWRLYTDSRLEYQLQSLTSYVRPKKEGEYAYMVDLASTLHNEIPYSASVNYFLRASSELKNKEEQEFLGLPMDMYGFLREGVAKQLKFELRDQMDLLLSQKLDQKKFICGDYAALFTFALAQEGINSAIVLNYEIPHAFNLVELQNNLFIVDPTWDQVKIFERDSSHGSYKDFRIYEPYGKAFNRTNFLDFR